MRKFLYVAAASVLLTSCVKEYKCECEVTATGETNQMLFRTRNKAHATRLCSDYETRVKDAVVARKTYTCKLN